MFLTCFPLHEVRFTAYELEYEIFQGYEFKHIYPLAMGHLLYVN